MTTLQPACFGKMPLFADFVRHGAPAPELGVLDQWLQDGIFGSRQKLGAQWEASFEALPLSRFFYINRSAQRVLGGVVTSSRDTAGRRFPFLIYTTLDARLLKGETFLLPVLLGGFMERAAETARMDVQGMELKAYLARVEGLASEADPEGARRRYQEFLAKETNRTFWTAVLGPQMDPQAVAAKYGLLQNVVETVGAGAIPRYALRIPVGMGDFGLAFWMDLCVRVERRLGPPALAAWDAGRPGAGAGATVVFDELQSKYFQPVFWPERPHPQLFPLMPSGAIPGPRLEDARKRFGAALQDPALPLGQVLQRLAR